MAGFGNSDSKFKVGGGFARAAGPGVDLNDSLSMDSTLGPHGNTFGQNKAAAGRRIAPQGPAQSGYVPSTGSRMPRRGLRGGAPGLGARDSQGSDFASGTSTQARGDPRGQRPSALRGPNRLMGMGAVQETEKSDDAGELADSNLRGAKPRQSPPPA